MISESLSFSFSFYCGTLFFICFLFFSSPLSLIRFLICFYKLPINRSALKSAAMSHPLQIQNFFAAFLFTTDAQSCWLRLFTSGASSTGRNDDEIEIGYYIMLSRLKGIRHRKQQQQKKVKKIYWPWNKFSARLFSFIPHSLSMQKQFETKRNKKWFLKQLNTQRADFLTFFSFLFLLFFDEMDDWHISRILRWVYWKKWRNF